MKILVLALTLMTLTSCSSLITRKELKSCTEMCQGSIKKLSKEDGQTKCECNHLAESEDFIPCMY